MSCKPILLGRASIHICFSFCTVAGKDSEIVQAVIVEQSHVQTSNQPVVINVAVSISPYVHGTCFQKKYCGYSAMYSM